MQTAVYLPSLRKKNEFIRHRHHNSSDHGWASGVGFAVEEELQFSRSRPRDTRGMKKASGSEDDNKGDEEQEEGN